MNRQPEFLQLTTSISKHLKILSSQNKALVN
jgi:hypothetical protein